MSRIILSLTGLVKYFTSSISSFSLDSTSGFLIRLVYEALKEMEMVDTDEKSIEEFFSKSGYHRRINQRTCAITQNGLLELLSELQAEKKKKGKDTYHSFDELIRAFTESVRSKAEEVSL